MAFLNYNELETTIYCDNYWCMSDLVGGGGDLFMYVLTGRVDRWIFL